MKENNIHTTVICLCHNQAPFVKEALESVALQTVANKIQLIIVDDASTDESKSAIVALLPKLKRNLAEVEFIHLALNVGNCKAFNKALAFAKGKYIIDLAADDVLYDNRVEAGMMAFENSGEKVGVHFCDVLLIDESGKSLGCHYKRNAAGGLIKDVPQGEVFKNILEGYFICTPSMMIKKEVFDYLDGYDESLAYEDFDFWVRSSKKFHYIFSDEVLVKKRELPFSLGKLQYHKNNNQLWTTIKVCRKAMQLISTEDEKKALIKRVRIEMRQAFASGKFEETSALWDILKTLNGQSTSYYLLHQFNKLKIDLSKLKRLYHKLKYG
jgi:glycosyltransferase involved in cell wall biosynthesis